MLEQNRILIVDDEPLVLQSCRRIFGDRGYEVETATSGQQGLDHLRRGYYDCALIDLKMPDLYGMELVREMREYRAETPVLIITGYADVESASEATRLGVSDYIRKPFTPQQIVHAVERALDRGAPTSSAVGLRRLADKIGELAPTAEAYDARSPAAVAEMVTDRVGVAKAAAPLMNTLILGTLAGAYIGFGAALATLVGHDASRAVGVGIGQLMTGAAFSVGLMLVVVAGAELFTGNNLMIAGALGKRFTPGAMLLRWAVVYAANFLGSWLLAYLMYRSGLWKMAAGAVGAKALAIAVAKTNLAFSEAFFRGVGCNWLVCLAVWMALSARDVPGKILAIFFPITAFVAIGYEHCVANMYFIPMGLLLKGAEIGTAGLELNNLTWPAFLIDNLIPVTLGNIVGGAIFVGSIYWLVFMRNKHS
jgi:formate/nitrite transporter